MNDHGIVNLTSVENVYTIGRAESSCIDSFTDIEGVLTLLGISTDKPLLMCFLDWKPSFKFEEVGLERPRGLDTRQIIDNRLCLGEVP
jgi:hypothetical protein